jgi:hypothetical protein
MDRGGLPDGKAILMVVRADQNLYVTIGRLLVS